MTDRWNVAILQMDVAYGQPEQNRAKMLEMVQSLQGRGERTDVLLLPELWDTAYDLHRLDEIADEGGASAQALLGDTANCLGGFVVGGSIAERVREKVYNTTYVFDRQGELIGRYAKAHLFRLMNEDKYLAAGDTEGLYQLDGHLAGSVICYDIRFPEWVRTYALKGAKVLFVSAQWPHPRLHHWRQLLIARAIENQMYVVACNRVGTGGKTQFCGHSMIIDPWGEIVVEAGEEEEVVQAQIDLSLVDEVRGRIPIFSDRRPALYIGE
ncbi:carbon-nitrogen family hydrolase [Brevibacillus humidisoli]|uniref:carbon-nitrogen family hydrolase n=1 Tax=Brevibacillus humidisoli TaxID=2895522 RepID=UPI001E38ACEC|nr:carbon-nitrogen family hydrolase [Brevibacillus humidisoli]UFJ43065.1 carbon-nitrogen family hydrolase [Brevibacillus humidisoli]